MTKPRILLITYYWPPAGGAGVQRWLTMSGYLAEDFEISVFCPDDAEYPIFDESLQALVHPNIQTIRTKIFEPQSLLKKWGLAQEAAKGNMSSSEKSGKMHQLAIWVRANIFIPDARMFWIKPAIKKLRQLLEKQAYDVVISTGPPHSTHLIALGVKKHFPDLKWVADWRDPWTDIDYFDSLPLTKTSLAKHEQLESQVLKHADALVSVSPSWAADMQRKSGREVEVIYNGYDAKHFEHVKDVELKKFTLLYMGSLNDDRNRVLLWQTLEELLTENEDFSKNFELKLVGNIAPITRKQIESLPNLSKKTLFQNYVPHEKVPTQLREAAMLLLLINDTSNAKGIIPAKVFEYMAANRPILSLGNRDSDIHTLMQKTGSGEVFEDTHMPEVKAYILKNFTDFLQGKLKAGNQLTLQNFTREAAAQQYAKLINRLVTA
ncbi:MAG: glycosyltransferase family 4 protein [Weeksellaceae bacterium]|nr:glycosyltransferase family 4 protein [Weeksellaceae bacterium]